MRYKGYTGYLIEDRNKDLLRSYNKIVRRGGFLSFAEIYAELSRVPASRFWVTGISAYEHLIKRTKGKNVTGTSNRHAERQAMYDEIERRARQYMEEHDTSLRNACKAVVLQRAPSFYLSPRTMEDIIRQTMRERSRRVKR